MYGSVCWCTGVRMGVARLGDDGEYMPEWGNKIKGCLNPLLKDFKILLVDSFYQLFHQKCTLEIGFAFCLRFSSPHCQWQSRRDFPWNSFLM